MVVNRSLPARTLPEFLGYAKDSKGEVAMASAGATGIEPAIFL
jgi:tripartite-type tricarboxylate transporter receptor subunit TctC